MAYERLVQLRQKGRGTDLSSAGKELSRKLAKKIRGEVRFDNGSRALYATDASNYRQVPIGVVLPKNIDDVLETIELARQVGAPILGRGGGTSLAGQCCNAAIIMDMSKYMNRVIDLDPDARTATVEPGVILDDLRNMAEEHHLTFGPDPATHAWCTLGGMIGNNSCGPHALMAGKTAENVIELDVVTYDGTRIAARRTPDDVYDRIVQEGGRAAEIYTSLRGLRDRYASLIRERYPNIPRRVSGYNLDELLPEKGFHIARALVGSESTCAIVLGAKVRLVTSPRERCLLVLGYPDVYTACDHITDILSAKPIALEGIDDRLIRYMRQKGMYPADIALLPQGGGWLLVELGGDTIEEAKERASSLMNRLRSEPNAPAMKLLEARSEQERVWRIRESGLGATAHVPGEPPSFPGFEDAAVPPEKLGHYLRDFRALLDRYGYGCALYGHFGQGCVHTRIDFDLLTVPGITQFHRFLEEGADLVVKYGGSLSGEHGDGQSRAELLPRMYGEELCDAFAAFKTIWDPTWKMNPGKVVTPYLATENLRLGSTFYPVLGDTHFSYLDDGGSFARAAQRCVGVGQCRRLSGGIMCPSFMVTREEKHTTRGRARLLFEMARGDQLERGFKEKEALEALELCLACKGCKSDCPVNVDMATYKAEVLSHYYKGRVRPMAAYSMGLIHTWARLGARFPGAFNSVLGSGAMGSMMKALFGIAKARKMPKIAKETFKSWFRRREPKNERGPLVVLWADTFNNFFTPGVARACVEVLEELGFRIEVPEEDLCCGRPLYDFGMLDRAERRLRRTLEVLRPHIEAGTPIVMLEPSCAAVFRDELVGLFPRDEHAKRLARQSMLLAQLLVEHAGDRALPELRRSALIQRHCHQSAVIGFDHDREVLSRLALDYELIDGGCCGMAGSFGFERGQKHEVSVLVGERVVLPAVRRALEDTLIMADGFSCREQISQGAQRRALHLAEVLRLALPKKRRSERAE